MTLVLPMTQYHYSCDYPTSLTVEEGVGTGEYTWEAGRITPRAITPLVPIDENREACSDADSVCITKEGDLTPTKQMAIAKSQAGIKRKLEYQDIGDWPKPKRPSILNNTPKQRREEKRKILKMSVHKLRNIDDPETVLHKAVLINNTMKRMQKEIREEKQNNTSPRKQQCENNSNITTYLAAPSCMYDEQNNNQPPSEKTSNDLSDRLMDAVQSENIENMGLDSVYCPYDITQNNDLTNHEQSPLSQCEHYSSSDNDQDIGISPSDTSHPQYEQTHQENKVFGEMDTVFNTILCSLES